MGSKGTIRLQNIRSLTILKLCLVTLVTLVALLIRVFEVNPDGLIIWFLDTLVALFLVFIITAGVILYNKLFNKEFGIPLKAGLLIVYVAAYIAVATSLATKLLSDLYTFNIDDIFYLFLLISHFLLVVFLLELLSYKYIAEPVLRTEVAVEKQRDEMEFFLDVLTHDLKTYLIKTHGFLELATSGRDYVNLIQRGQTNLSQATELLNNVTTLLKSSVETDYRMEPVDIDSQWFALQKSLEHIFPEKEVEIELQGERGLVCEADTLLGQLFLNLLTNAVKNTPEASVLTQVHTSVYEQGHILIRVIDSGKGINPEVRKSLFTRYRTFKEHGRGSGLGLYIVQKLVERYHGKVWVESRCEKDYRKGTIFNILLISCPPPTV